MHLRSKTVQQLLSVILSVVMVLSMLPMEVLAQETPPVTTPMDLTAITEDTSGDGWSWTQSTKTLALTGLTLTDPQVGSLAAVPEEQSGDLARLLELLRQLRSKGMTAQIGEIRFEESGIVLRYQDRLDVCLDREDDFAYRLRYLAAVLEKLEENETGTIRWDAEGSARFIPG